MKKSKQSKTTKNLKRIKLISLISLFTLTTVGCSARLKDFLDTDINAAMHQRVSLNQQIADQLYASNFISSKTHEMVINNLDNIASKYDEQAESLASSGKTTLTRSISRYVKIDGLDIHTYFGADSITDNDGKQKKVFKSESDYTPTDGLNDLALANYLCSQGVLTDTADTYDTNPEGVQNVAEPMVLVDDKVAAEVNKKFGFEVYVLSPDIFSSDGTNSIDGITELLQSNIKKTEKGTKVNVGTLNNYFVKALDENGEAVTLLDMTKEENKIIKNSLDQPLNGQNTQPGYDMIVKQWGVPSLSFKFTEFSQEAVNNLDSIVGLNEGKYIFSTDNGINRVYLLEYPVSILSSLIDNQDNTVSGELTKSGLGINLWTGNLIKYDSDGNGGWLASGTPISNPENSYLTVSGADNETQTGKSSFIIKGMTTTEIRHSLIDDGASKTIQCGRIILRDYLEATYAPEFVTDEPLAIFGRKIRIKFTDWIVQENYNNTKYSQFTPKWSKESDMASFVDRNGVEVVNSPKLQITDFCDAESINSVYADKAKVVSLTLKSATPAKTPAEENSSGTSTIDNLEHETVNTSIKPTLMFPGTEVGLQDYNVELKQKQEQEEAQGNNADSEQKQRFYALTTKCGLFDSALYSTWIESQSTEASLDWWNTYLKENKFIYTVNHSELNDYLKSFYAYELSQDGVIILDLKIVAKIQDEFTADANTERMHTMRTFFMILGWFLICWSISLMLGWLIDTNVDIGMRVLEKLSFGYWVAVKYEEDLPQYNADQRSYMTASQVTLRCIVIIVVGIILIYVNELDIVLYLIKLFGGPAQQLEKLIGGLR
ncbi:hypothetical protein [Konateibacter massiliensis]|uniref:hypothetical protein n=1 Tax=Konateibacter massiliensis TaxID=2002841 RepID=UPI000C15C45B|nr:hypothetical protein [Konateibacter massiliensis]